MVFTKQTKLGLSKYKSHFLLINIKNTKELMGKEKLRELAIVLFDRVRKNTSIDWTIRESAKAKLRVVVKRTLRQFGYPPDMQALAVETVLKQAELITGEIVDSEDEFEGKTRIGTFAERKMD